MKLKRKHLFLAVLTFTILLFCTYLWARAGGAGSSSSSSSGSSDDGAMVVWLIIQIIRFIWIVLPFPINLIVIMALVVAAIYVTSKGKNAVQEKSVFNDIPAEAGHKKKTKGYNTFLHNNPDFDKEVFVTKVENVFMQVQQAWMNMNLSHVRKFMSDGVYQRFNTQFQMMDLLKQKNKLSNIKVLDVFIDRIEKDGQFDIVHVGIMASMNDEFTSKLDSSLNMGGYNKFVEYWSFIRKRGIQPKDMFDTPSCPNCGGTIDEGLGEICKCPFCNSLLNSGEYDWVLSEITQSDDYVSKNPAVIKKANLSTMTEKLVSHNDDFAVQFIEDKASNGYLQILTAKALHKPQLMRRFVSDTLYSKVETELNDNKISYNRLFLNDVTLIGIQEENTQYKLFVSVKSSYQRVKIRGSAIDILDPFVISDTQVLVMSREKSAGINKGSIYSHNCPSCGGTVNDTVDIDCQYCGNPLNSNKNEWIIDDILDLDEYGEYLAKNKTDFGFKVSLKMIESMYDVRDYALNNVLVIVAVDRVFDETEKALVNKLAKKWGYNPQKIQGLYNMAANGSLTIQMPEEMKKREKIFKLMTKAALADGIMAPEEQTLLDAVQERYLQNQ